MKAFYIVCRRRRNGGASSPNRLHSGSIAIHNIDQLYERHRDSGRQHSRLASVDPDQGHRLLQHCSRQEDSGHESRSELVIHTMSYIIHPPCPMFYFPILTGHQRSSWFRHSTSAPRARHTVRLLGGSQEQVEEHQGGTKCKSNTLINKKELFMK